MAETGYWRKTVRIKENATPIDNKTKFAWADDDYEEVDEWVEYTEEELAELEDAEAEEKNKEFLKTADDRLSTVENGQNELLSALLDLLNDV